MNNPRLNTPLNKISKTQIKRLSNKIFTWVCSKYKHPANLQLKISSVSADRVDAYGWYMFIEKRIIINHNKIHNVKDLIETILHEFKHSQQDGYIYDKLLEKYGYVNNPYEKSAIRFAQQRIYKCWNEIKT